MTHIEKLTSLLTKKLERQALLKQTSAELEELDNDLWGSKFTRTFGSTYLIVKRILTLLIAIGLLFGAFLLLFLPEYVLQDEDLKSDMIEESKEYYAELAGMTLNQALLLAAQNNSHTRFDDVLDELDKAFDVVIEREIRETIIAFAVLLLITSFIFWYISRLTNKMRIRNAKITKAETLTREVIASFKHTIEEEEKELELLNEIVKASLNQNTQN